MINFRTDLALERRDLFKKANNTENDVDGLKTQEETFDNNIKVSRVKVLNENYGKLTKLNVAGKSREERFADLCLDLWHDFNADKVSLTDLEKSLNDLTGIEIK